MLWVAGSNERRRNGKHPLSARHGLWITNSAMALNAVHFVDCIKFWSISCIALLCILAQCSRNIANIHRVQGTCEQLVYCRNLWCFLCNSVPCRRFYALLYRTAIYLPCLASAVQCSAAIIWHCHICYGLPSHPSNQISLWGDTSKWMETFVLIWLDIIACEIG